MKCGWPSWVGIYDLELMDTIKYQHDIFVSSLFTVVYYLLLSPIQPLAEYRMITQARPTCVRMIHYLEFSSQQISNLLGFWDSGSTWFLNYSHATRAYLRTLWSCTQIDAAIIGGLWALELSLYFVVQPNFGERVTSRIHYYIFKTDFVGIHGWERTSLVQWIPKFWALEGVGVELLPGILL